MLKSLFHFFLCSPGHYVLAAGLVLGATAELAAQRNAGAAGGQSAAVAAQNAAGQQDATTASPPAAEQPAAADLAATAADPVAQELLANSPFMSKSFKERLAKSEGSRTRDLAFRGFAGKDGTWLICVYNNQSKRAEWVELGAEVNGVTIAEFDKEGLRIKVVKDAISTYLNLEQPR